MPCFRSQRHQRPGLHGMAGHQLHAPRLGHRRQHQEPFHPRKPFAETLARTAAKGEIGSSVAGAASGGAAHRVGTNASGSAKIARVAMREVRADEEEGACAGSDSPRSPPLPAPAASSTTPADRAAALPTRPSGYTAAAADPRRSADAPRARSGAPPASPRPRRDVAPTDTRSSSAPARSFRAPPAGGSGLRRGSAADSWDCRPPSGRRAASRAHRPSPRLWPGARQSADRSGYPDSAWARRRRRWLGQRQAAQQGRKGQGHPGGEPQERRDRTANGGRLVFHIGIQQGFGRDRQRDPHHGGGNIQRVPVLPRLAAAARL